MKIAVCFGGTYNMYGRAGIVKELAKEFKEKDSLVFVDGSTELKIFYSYGLVKDKVLIEQYKKLKHKGEIYSLPSSEVVNEVKKYNPDVVLFFGIAAGVNKKINQIFYPVVFSKVIFHKYENIVGSDINISNSISVNNLFGSKFERIFKKEKMFSSNLAFSPSIVGTGGGKEEWSKMWHLVEKDLNEYKLKLNGKEAIEKWCELKFKKEIMPVLNKFDLIDMEVYSFAETFSDKLGVMVLVSDVAGEYYDESKIDWKHFNLNVIKNIKKVIKK